MELANVEAASAQQLTTTAFALAVVLAGLIAIWLTATISRPVSDLESGMQAVADGDFSYRLSIEPMRHDEFGRLAESYQTMVQQLKQLDQLKAEFVSVASHELKTPINVIIGYLQLLQENVYGELTPKQREICLTLASQAQALSRLVRQLLDVSRFEAGGGKLELRSMRLIPFLAELESTFRVLAIQRGIRFHVDRGSRLPDHVVWDEDRMSEVLGNLLSNAFKFTERGGTVELTVATAKDSVRDARTRHRRGDPAGERSLHLREVLSGGQPGLRIREGDGPRARDREEHRERARRVDQRREHSRDRVRRSRSRFPSGRVAAATTRWTRSPSPSTARNGAWNACRSCRRRER